MDTSDALQTLREFVGSTDYLGTSDSVTSAQVALDWIRERMIRLETVEERLTAAEQAGQANRLELANERTWKEGAAKARDASEEANRKLRYELEAFQRRGAVPSIPCAEVLVALTTAPTAHLNASELTNRARVALNDFGKIRLRAEEALALLERVRVVLNLGENEAIPAEIHRVHGELRELREVRREHAKLESLLVGIVDHEVLEAEIESADDWNREEDLVPTIDRLLQELATYREEDEGEEGDLVEGLGASPTSTLQALVELLESKTTGSVEVECAQLRIKITASD